MFNLLYIIILSIQHGVALEHANVKQVAKATAECRLIQTVIVITIARKMVIAETVSSTKKEASWTAHHVAGVRIFMCILIT